ncbi:MAG TPA: hypothetical protein VK761_01640 [Solirubrobacteraceae bacterium]|nr:hypothetical protein [Solirubrobacteraceae bacterium]
MTPVLIALTAWLALLSLFVVLRLRATRKRQMTLENVRAFPLQGAAVSKLAASARQPAATASRGPVAAAGPRR